MVREANIKQACAEKSLKESLMQVEVLSAEVAALKALVLTSTPSRPNPHLHPQIKDDAGKFYAYIISVIDALNNVTILMIILGIVYDMPLAPYCFRRLLCNKK